MGYCARHHKVYTVLCYQCGLGNYTARIKLAPRHPITARSTIDTSTQQRVAVTPPVAHGKMVADGEQHHPHPTPGNDPMQTLEIEDGWTILEAADGRWYVRDHTGATVGSARGEGTESAARVVADWHRNRRRQQLAEVDARIAAQIRGLFTDYAAQRRWHLVFQSPGRQTHVMQVGTVGCLVRETMLASSEGPTDHVAVTFVPGAQLAHFGVNL